MKKTAPIKTTQKPEPPKRRKLFLIAEGASKPTLHVFVDTVLEAEPAIGHPEDVPNYGAGWLRPQWAPMFKCTKTGAVRKYGVIDATEASDRFRSGETGLT